MDLYLLKDFNNYFNRKVIRLSTLQDYLDHVEEDGYFIVKNTNFNPNDGISTSHVIGSGNKPFDKDWQPDYCLVIDWPDGGQPRIVSRWYVTESSRTMVNQYTVALKRDSVVDKYDPVISADTYIEKAPCKGSDPLIVNNEGLRFNQIKTKEYFLKDKTKVPWIVCYLNQHERPFKEIKALYSSSETEVLENHPEIMSFFGWDEHPELIGEKDVVEKVFEDNNFNYRYWYYALSSQVFWSRWTYNHVDISIKKNNGTLTSSVSHANESTLDDFVDHRAELNGLFYNPLGTYILAAWLDGWNEYNPTMKTIATRLGNAMVSQWETFTAPYLSASGATIHSDNYELPEFARKYNGVTFYSRTKDRYLVFNFSPNKTDYDKDATVAERNLGFINNNKGSTPDWAMHSDCNKIRVKYSVTSYQFTMSYQVGAEIKLDLLGKADETHQASFQSQIQPYDIICFPAHDCTIINEDGDEVQLFGDAGYNIARAIATQLGEANIYDIQVMPFCPCQELLNKDTNKIDLSKAGTNQFLPVVETATQDIVSYCLFATLPYIELNIDTLHTSIWNDATDRELPIISIDELSVTERKIQANCDLFRLNSPNFASAFDFNVAKCIPLDANNFTNFNVDVVFRPHNPYIHVNPNFGFLYGQDFNDSRGLICSGDFGLTVISNAWTNYQVQNKNYQNIFDRQMQNMEVSRQISREQEQWDITRSWIGSTTGIAKGAVGGALSGTGAAGIALGAIAGGISSGLGIANAYKQSEWSERAYQEQRAFATDMFNMQLDNIKALPNTITHTSSLTNNFKFFPTLEYYTCTSEEKEILRSKMKYNGMTVGRIDRIINYLSDNEECFIKGQVIRLARIGDDAHLAQDIYNEINKGLFFVPESLVAKPIRGGNVVWAKTTQK